MAIVTDGVTEVLSRNVVYGRAKRRISQYELARRAKVARATISGIEMGTANPTVLVLEKIARVLHCRVEELFAARPVRVDDAELQRRANAPRTEFVNARALLDAIDEANEVRYSPAGRRKTMDRRVPRGRR